MKKILFKIAICLGLIVACCSSCALSEKKQDEMSPQTNQQPTGNSLTSDTTIDVADESNSDGSVDSNTESEKAEKISSKLDKMFQNATNNTPVLIINGRVITEFEYSIFKWQYSRYSDIKEEVIRSVLISQEMERLNFKLTKNSKKQVDQIINWLRDEGSFTSAESETRYKMSKKDLVDICENQMVIEALNWDFEDIFFKKLVDGTLNEIDPSLQEACDEYQKIQADVDAFKVSYKRLEDCYQKTLNNYIDLLKSRATIVEGS